MAERSPTGAPGKNLNDMTEALQYLAAVRAGRRHKHASREQVIEFQNRRLSQLLEHAYQRVPYYRRLFDRRGIKPKDIRSIVDLAEIPITSRKDLQGLPADQIVADNVDPRRLLTSRTSGSSGEPFVLRQTWLEERALSSLYVRGMKDLGLRFTDRLAVVTLDQPHADNRVPLPWRMLKALDPRHKAHISCLLPPEEIRRRLEQIRPDVVLGFSGVLAEVARVSGSGPIRPRLVLTGGEVLTAQAREQISRAFGPVYELYGSNEFALIGWECRVSRELHVCDDGLILEVVREGRAALEGEQGEVVATNLHAFAMPLIRYRLGDAVTRGCSSCGCGRPFSTVRVVQGRVVDYFHLPDGRLLHPYELIHPQCENAPWIRQYRLTQERANRIVLQIVPAITPGSQDLAAIRTAAVSALGPGVDFEIQLTGAIPLEPNGKFRVYRSLINSNHESA